MVESVTEKAIRALRRYQMLRPGDAVLVAFSGGADSVTLLSVLISLKEELGLREIKALHLNHGLRGEESDADECFAKAFCEQRHIPFLSKCADVAAFSKEHGIGLEDAGRMLRYEFFESVRAHDETVRIATAHTMSDTMETMLFHIARGCGVGGLAGIPPVRGAVIRPLIDCTRQEIEAYCRVHGLSYVTDSTNADTQYARNQIRHEVIPPLYQINPGLDKAFARLSKTAGREDAFLQKLSDQALSAVMTGNGADVVKMKALDPAIRFRVIKKWLEDHKLKSEESDCVRIDELLTDEGRVSLSDTMFAVCRNGILSVEEARPAPEMIPPVEVEIGGTYEFSDKIYRFSLISKEEYEKKKKIHNLLFKNAISCDMINNGLFLRSRCEGDTLRPAGRGVSKSLKKLFSELKIPTDERDRIGLLCDRDGILSVIGITCDERVRIKDDTKTVLLIEQQGAGEEQTLGIAQGC